VLSYFGLVPAALAGVNVEAMLHRSQVAEQNCTHFDQTSGNSGLWMGIAMGGLAEQGRDKLTFIVDDPLESFGLWAEQLVAESTGKQDRGILPIADEPLVTAAEYGPDRVFAHVSTGDVEVIGKVGELSAAGHPVFTLAADGPDDLGRVFFLSEFATAVAGWVLGINPFDQPNVQEAKDNTKRVLEEGSPELDPGDVEALVGALEPPRYLAIMGYLPYAGDVESGAGRYRERVLRRHHVATTFGYGPRFQHSTGQMHKGGPKTGLFLQLVHDGNEDADIPGEGYSFATLKNE
jgi:hypothetical protein